MRKFAPLFIILPLLTINAFVSGQANFVKAVIVNNNGDSLQGTIDYRNWKNNPQTINFINDADEKKTFDASSIRGFYLPAASEIYTSFTVKMDMLPSDKDEAIRSSYIDSPTLNKRVFLLQLLIHPLLRLYQFTGNQKDHFYYVKENEEPVELIHHYVFDESTQQVNEDVTYKEQLSGVFAACPAVVGKLTTIKFRKKEIQDIARQYLQCSAPGSAVDIKKKDSISFKFGIVAGLMFNKFKFEGEDSPLADENYSSSLSPAFGISFDLGLARNRNKWHIINELIYKSYKTTNSFSKKYGPGSFVASDVDIYFSYIQLNSMLRYIFQSHAPLKPYINLGMGNASIISENKNEVHSVYSFGGGENAKAIQGPNKSEFSMLAGGGIMFRSFQVELRYGRSRKSFSPYHTLDVNPTSFQFISTYQF